jgi:4-hydroxybenzoate polyprenyltransferase
MCSSSFMAPNKPIKHVTTPESKGDFNRDSVGDHYGGNQKSGWLSILPDAWLPYVQLARLSPPAGLFLIYFPHIFGILHAAILQHTPPSFLFQTSALMFGGSFFVSNAIHIWNDLIDAPLDALVERTRNRPVPRGAVSPFAATVFTATQAIGAALFLPYLTPNSLQSILYALPSILGWTYYPWAKRHTSFPQIVLGFCLAWGVVMGSLAMGLEPFGVGALGLRSRSHVHWSTLCLFLANILWTMIYDTVYAYLDLEDDRKAGIKSMAVRYHDRLKPLLWQLLALKTLLLLACGWLSEMGLAYYSIAVGGAAMALGLMIAKVELKSAASCWWWFSHGFWFAGGALSGGLLVEYLRGIGV